MAGRGFTVKKHWDNPVEHAMPAEARVPAEVRLGAVAVRPATVLAPMAGVTDTVFRRFIRHASLFTHAEWSKRRPSFSHLRIEKWGARFYGSSRRVAVGEDGDRGIDHECAVGVRADDDGVHFGRWAEPDARDQAAALSDVLRRRASHRRAAVRIESGDAGEAARIVEETGFDTVDLNLGCPAKRVVGSNGGSGLLRDLPKIGEIFRAIRKAVTIPFTVKFRMGWNESQIVCVELARMAEAEGLNGLALHARTREQGYSGQAQWDWIAAVKQAVRLPVIGNGDIRTPEDAAAMVAETGCDAVMIGRAAPANPWIFRQIAAVHGDGPLRAADHRGPLPDDPRVLRDADGGGRSHEGSAARCADGRSGGKDEAVCHVVYARRAGRREAARGHLPCARRRRCAGRGGAVLCGADRSGRERGAGDTIRRRGTGVS